MSLASVASQRRPILQTLHHSPTPTEVGLVQSGSAFVAISEGQARLLGGLNVVATIHHAVDMEALPFRAHPDDYLLFLGRFTEGKGVLQAIDVAKRTGIRLILAAAGNEYYQEAVAPLVDDCLIVYAGEVDGRAKADLMGGARALLYPVQEGEPFGLVLAEAAACGTPVAALDRGAVREIVDEGVTGGVFDTLEASSPTCLACWRSTVRRSAARWLALAPTAWWTPTWTHHGSCRAVPEAGPRLCTEQGLTWLAPATPCWPYLHIRTTSRWRAVDCWRDALSLASGCHLFVRHAASMDRPEDGARPNTRRSEAFGSRNWKRRRACSA